MIFVLKLWGLCQHNFHAIALLDESSVVAIRDNGVGNRQIVAVGTDAKRMLGRTPGNPAALVMLFGEISKGAQRWLDFGVFRFQPSEIK